MANGIQKDLGKVTAYSYAKAAGYTGTEEQFQAIFNEFTEDAPGLIDRMDTAVARAEAAVTNIDATIQDAVDDAVEEATASAVATANQAVTDAQAAQTAAEGAVTQANNAVTQANAAVTAAQAAQTAAEDAAESFVLDRTLTDSGAAAPADLVGDLKESIDDQIEMIDNGTIPLNVTFEHGTINQSTGEDTNPPSTARARTVDYISTDYSIHVNHDNYLYEVYLYYYDENKVFQFRDSGSQANIVTPSKNYPFYRIAILNRSAMSALLDLQILNENVSFYKNANFIKELQEETDLKIISSLGVLNHDIFELGQINIGDNGWSYTDSSLRVRLKENVVLKLKEGDVIGLKDYTKYRFYIGWVTEAGVHGRSGWRSSDYTVDATSVGQYVVMIRPQPDSSEPIEDYTVVADQFFGTTVMNYLINNFITNDQTLILPHNYFVKSIIHRGYRNGAPENTLPAFKLARQRGFEYVETDIAFTSDNIPVLLHDQTINRTAKNADGTEISETISISDITYEQALQYVFCGNYYYLFPTVKIPSLAEFMTLCRNIGLQPYLELKNGVGTNAQISTCIDIVKNAYMIDHTTWISYDANMLNIVKGLSSKSRLGFLVSSSAITQSTIDAVSALKTTDNEVFIISNTLTTEEVELCADAGIPLESGSENQSQASILSLPPYVSGVITDGNIAGQILFDNYMEL